MYFSVQDGSRIVWTVATTAGFFATVCGEGLRVDSQAFDVWKQNHHNIIVTILPH
jgi:hypothetical protein